jgi:hypothetical protein
MDKEQEKRKTNKFSSENQSKKNMTGEETQMTNVTVKKL